MLERSYMKQGLFENDAVYVERAHREAANYSDACRCLPHEKLPDRRASGVCRRFYIAKGRLRYRPRPGAF